MRSRDLESLALAIPGVVLENAAGDDAVRQIVTSRQFELHRCTAIRRAAPVTIIWTVEIDAGACFRLTEAQTHQKHPSILKPLGRSNVDAIELALLMRVIIKDVDRGGRVVLPFDVPDCDGLTPCVFVLVGIIRERELDRIVRRRAARPRQIY